jgi:LEA14-like dessication related protein
MKKFIIIVAVIFLASCGILKKMQTFAKCDFKLKSLDPIMLAGVNIQKKSSFNNLNIFDVAKVTAAYIVKSVPIDITANIFATNPNSSPAAMTKMDWIFYIDKTQIVSGILNKRIDIPANGGTATFTVEIKADLIKVLSGQSKESIQNFAFGLTDANNKASSRITLKVKPYVTIAGINISYPDYFTLTTHPS